MGLLADALAKATKPPVWHRRPEVLLSANTVKPMHGVTPRTILGQEWWDRTRHEAYRSTSYHCIACGVYKLMAWEHQWLEGHELYQTDYPAGRMTYVETVPLCHYCHCFIHDGRLKVLLDKGEISQKKYDAVMAHGKAVLKVAGLKKAPYAGKVAEWSRWRLVLEGKEYSPIYKDYQQWFANFNSEEGE